MAVSVTKEPVENEEIEIELLVEAINRKYGYDFRNYAKASLRRRIMHRFAIEDFANISEMQHRVLNDEKLLEKLLLDLSINTTEMFRDPLFYRALRTEIFPLLKPYSSIKIWHAGCSTGEEVYSTAILMKEEGLYDRATIYATDFNEVVLKKAKEGIFPIDTMKKFTSNYQDAGGREEFSGYYISKGRSVIMNGALKENIVFADHNLVTDSVFGEMNLIMCRNVFIYFNNKLQDHVIRLFRDSLAQRGILCLGSRETIDFSKYAGSFRALVKEEKIYEKKD
jgi:chemotaxis protein methyltransferase CheR